MCSTCSQGYLLTNGICDKIPCTSNDCSLCDINQVCLKCVNEYALFNPITKACVTSCVIPNC